METNTPKELSLIQVIVKSFNWLVETLKRLLFFSGKLLQLSVKHWIISTISFLLIFSGSLYLSRKSAQKYKVGTTIHIAFTDAPFIGDLIDNLSGSVANSKGLTLGDKLNLPEEIASSVYKIKRFNLIDYRDDEVADIVDLKRNHDLSDTTNIVMDNKIYIQFRTKKPEYLDTIHVAMMRYFNENFYVKDEYDLKMKSYTYTSKMLKRELNRIDSMASIHYFSKDKNIDIAYKEKNDDGRFTISAAKPVFQEEIQILLDRIHHFDNILATNRQPVYTTDGFIIKGPVNPRLKFALFGVLFGGAFALFNSFVYANRKKIYGFLLSK